jgi:hypothetical protein
MKNCYLEDLQKIEACRREAVTSIGNVPGYLSSTLTTGISVSTGSPCVRPADSFSCRPETGIHGATQQFLLQLRPFHKYYENVYKRGSLSRIRF